MGVKSFIKKSVSLMSAMAMTLSMIAIPSGSVFAEEGSSSDSGLELNKTVELQQDGTYKIRLESYATGEYTTVTEKSGVPLDIVLVLDQSGSMDDKVNGVKKINSLKTAVTNFVTNISNNAKEYNVDHRIALVGYASRYDSNDKWANTGLFINGNLYNYQQAGSSTKTSRLTAQNYKDALVNVNNSDGSITNSITTAIGNIDANGATYTNYGLEMANGVFSNNPIESGSDRKRIVVVFTDGEPGRSGYDESVAGTAVNEAYKTKNTYGATVYSVGFYDKASTNVTNFMNYISSNYPSAEYKKNWWNQNYTFVPGDKADTKYYMTATNQTELNNIFTNISKDIENPSTSVKLDKNAVTRDIITDKLNISDNTKVTAYTEDYKGSNTWEKSATQVALTTTINKETKTVDVTGFDYAANFVDLTKAKGQRLVIEITGLTANEAGENMITNVTEKSGVYADNKATTPADIFNECSITIDSKSYVLDYGKTVSTSASDYGVGAVTIANTGKPSPYGVNLTGEYGTFAISGGNLNYTPGKINWDGIDTGYVFGQKSSSTEYQWKEVNFIPATSVYYEDDFGLDNNTDSNVAIVWTGDWSKGTSQDEQQSSSNSQYGWDDSYTDDTGFSNGSAHEVTVSNQTKATATFRFTGTGVDVYSRTNKNVGRILGQLKKIENNKIVSSKVLIVDNQSVSGDYYQIPTLSFDNLAYGTYELTINVSPVTESNGNVRGTYYLDGIRVYNPLGTVDADSTEGKAYEEAGESNAQYIQVRKILLDAETFGTLEQNKEGTVFIDKSETNSPDETSDVLGVYKDYGPKNEVYAANSQGIAFNIGNYNSSKNKVFIGLKAPSGQGTTVEVTNGSGKQTLIIDSTADLYYPITPDTQGNIVIKNIGGNLLSITKVRITTSNSTTTNGTYSLMVGPELMSYVQNFESLYVTKDDVNNEETKEDEDITLDQDDVVIENPSEDTSNESDQNNEEIKQNTATSFWQKVSSSISKLFGRK